MTDRIVYQLITEPGGEDGRDHNDKGGTATYATFEKDAAIRKKGNDSRLRIEPGVVDTDQVMKEAMAKLTLVERLVLFPPDKKVMR
ncbi:hypothetical protein HOV23_gp111 [Pseudomonas phage Lana]|uniref:Uncharacterized protein n=1 Tax=Pseudomonas phage Lana TaxID=2530172 RepID=A0A481W7Q4_9CAUD|nr:hypothetical protein HOV23_gp111 [Pseudomonas phage Lana]QBJ04462.1 hypothetical protein [Pseudomonas phage Lana]